MARALGWNADGKRLAPFYVDLESPAPENGIPKPGPLSRPSQGRPSAIRRHLVRAGAVMVIAFLVWWRAQRRTA